MSSIDKLQVLGVRSFDNKRAEIIKFFNPLTLIVGLNGSGKTTIIECLRYATTGELPPNSSTGGAWIHDPKLCGENEVLAQIKLSFNTASNERMVMTRSIQLTVKRNTRSQKVLDCTLARLKNGEKTTVSSRVADLDRLMPEGLGVSKAILENVIFCHQEDSLWPMSTPAVLKKKFDEIFEALKYTKAIENIKLIRKGQIADLQSFESQEKAAKLVKDQGEKAQKDSEELYNEIEELREGEEGMRDQIKEANDKSEAAWNQVAQFDKIVVALSGKRIEAQAVSRSLHSLKQHMQVMSQSDQDLRDMLEQYEDRLQRHENEKQTAMRKYQDFVHSIASSRKLLGEKQEQRGVFEGQKQRYDQQIEKRQELIKDTARRHGMRGFDDEIDDDRAREFLEKLRRMTREQQGAYERARKSTREESDEARQEQTKLNGRKSELMQTKSSATASIQGNDAKILRYQGDLDKIDVDEGSQAVIESNLRNLEARVTRAKDDLAQKALDTKIRVAEADIKSLEAEKTKLDHELLEASRRATESARLDLLHKDLEDRRKKLQTMQGVHETRINKILGKPLALSTLEQDFQLALTTRSEELKNEETKRDAAARELEQAKYKLTASRDSLKRKEREFSSHEEAVSACIEEGDFGVPDFLEYFEQVEADAMQASADQSSYVATKAYFEQCKKTLEEKRCCRLCSRDVDTKEDEKRLLDNINRALTRANNSLKDDFVAKAQESLTKVRQGRPHYDAWLALRDELPPLRIDIKNLSARTEELTRQLETHDDSVRTHIEVKRDVESIAKTIQSITKYHSEIADTESQIQQVAVSQKTQGLARGLESIQAEQQKMAEEIRSLNATLQDARSSKERAQTEIFALEHQVRDAQAELSTAKHRLKERDQLEAQVQELKTNSIELRAAIKQADQEIQSLIPKISQVEARLDDIRSRGDERDTQLRNEATKLANSLNQLTSADEEINSYINDGGPQQLARANREIEAVQNDIDRVEGEQTEVIKQIKKLETDLSTHQETKRAINDNLSYRENVKSLQTLESEISRLEEHNAEDDKQHFEYEALKWQNIRNKLSAEQATIVGTLKSKDDQLQKLLQQWELEFKDAEQVFREAHIRCVVTKAAIQDLAQYGNALDKAIMKYHSLKMEEINRIIDELWRQTYQGTDVDTVMIKSENETQKGNKSYNYRVVMMKQDAEMDMRGRCSAGQKVLASIIIRLALAECFGTRCGLIALDEPTTNLDRDNIMALATALAGIIRMRRQQANFQLIVITHDEEFLRAMNCADFTDYYYRVSRDANQCSQIYKQSIQNVSAYKTENLMKITEFEL